MSERAISKAERLGKIEQLLLHHPEGMTQAELARRLNVHRSTILRDMPALTQRCAVYDQPDGRLVIDRDAYLTNVRFTLHEAMAIHLAARLMTQHNDKFNPHGAAALRKLSTALNRLAPFISDHMAVSANLLDGNELQREGVYLHILESLTRAWSLGHKVRLEHQMPDGQTFWYTFSPYYIEPYAAGRTHHVIGYRKPPGAIRTFKVERIKQIELLEEVYRIPADFDAQTHLADAWGIWTSDEPPVKVVVKFSPRVAQRVLETSWHKSQKTARQNDGSLLWSAQIADTQEMLPWLRGWGCEVEIVEPAELRERVISEVTQLARMYDIGEIPPIPPYQLLWGKTDRKTGTMHPLICHMLDVAAVTQALWDKAFSAGIKDHIAQLLNIDSEQTGRILSFWSGLHDLGKATPAFQRKYQPAIATLENEGYKFPQSYGMFKYNHGIGTACFLPGLLEKNTGLPRQWSFLVAFAISGHHGAWPIPQAVIDMENRARDLGAGFWEEQRLAMYLKYAEMFPLHAVPDYPESEKEINALLVLISGIVSVADWIGSMEIHYPYTPYPVNEEEYWIYAKQQAVKALSAHNWLSWSPPQQPMDFSQLFNLPSPRSMQAQAIALAEKLKEPALVIIEAPTGCGKTEAALYMADFWAQAQQQQGLYVAMPTMATSNQMYARVKQMTEHRYRDMHIAPLLIHSQARWLAQTSLPVINSVNQDDETGVGSVETLAWFLPRKGSLLAPLAVGTVDQSLLSVMQIRHFFVRLFGLSHKTIIFDEVHAYDTYMSTLFQRLIAWLNAVGSSVIILSATLPAKTRSELLKAYAGAEIEVPPVTNPAISWATQNEIGCAVSETEDYKRMLQLSYMERDDSRLIASLNRALEGGGCAAIICNTVNRAQKLYAAILKFGTTAAQNLILFHARYPMGCRQKIEERVLSLFGKSGARPERAVLVATQIIEQSLDLDFDVMYTDLAPIDMLIQRAGRMHRHDRGRPERHSKPMLHIILPSRVDGHPEFERADTYIYDEYVLRRTLLALKQRSRLVLPDETSTLIEAVYSDADNDQEGMTDQLRGALKQMQDSHIKDEYSAREKLVAAPNTDNLLFQRNLDLAEDNPEVTTAFQALTRLSLPSVRLVCLHLTAQGLRTQPGAGGQNVKIDNRPNDKLVAELDACSVSLTHWSVVNHFRKPEYTPQSWRKHPLLKQYKLAEFVDGKCDMAGTGFTLVLSDELGIQVLSDNE